MDTDKKQKKMLALCWITYALAYTLRVNIAAVIPAMSAKRGYTFAQMGLVTALFFISYMFGQLVNGYLGDTKNSRFMIISGLSISALCNLGMAFAADIRWLAAIWAINGLAQSMLWAPIMKVLSVWFRGRELEKVSFTMALSMIIGYAVSWGLSSLIADTLGWEYAFGIPALAVLIFSVIMFFVFQTEPPENMLEQNTQDEIINNEQGDLSIPAFFRLIRLPGLLLIALSQGFIREGISIWFPTMIGASGTSSISAPWMILTVIPFINLGGIIFIRKINRRQNGDSTRTLLFVFSMAAVISMLLNLIPGKSSWLTLSVTVLLLALAYGLTPVLTSIIPFQYARYKRVALTAGIIDFSIYLGAALSGILSGMIADRFSWDAVMLLWLGAAVTGLAVSIFRYGLNKRRMANEQKIGI